MLFRTASLFFIVLLVLPVSVYAQEEIATTPPEENSGDISQTEEIGGEETQTIVEETNPTEKTASSSETVDAVIPVEQISIDVEEEQEVVSATTSVSLVESVDIQVLSKVVASSSDNQTLPFSLISEKTVFGIPEAVSFTFAYQTDEAIEEGFAEEVFTNVVSAVQEIYEGSFVETIVESITNAVDVVVDFVIPEVQGQVIEEPIPADIDSEVTVPLIETLRTEEVVDEPQETLASSTLDVEEIVTPAPLPATSSESFAVVDGVRTSLNILNTSEGQFTVELEAGVYTLGLHSLELHIFFEQEMYVGYYTFTIEGSVVETLVLTSDLIAVVIADTSLAQTLWLQKRLSSSTVSWEKIADETSMAQNPILTFVEDVLFWTTQEKDALIGFDINSNSTFSQTLNTNNNAENTIEVDSGTYDITSDIDSLQVEFIPEPVI